MSEIFNLATQFDDNGRALPEQATPASPPRRVLRDKLDVINPSQWSGQDIPQRRWIVEGMVPSGAVTMLTGDGGLGKSLLTMQLLVAAAAGRPWLGLPVSPCRCLGIFCEDEADELHRRLADIADFYEIGFESLQNLRLVSRVGKANELWTVDKYGKPKEPSLLYRQVLDEARSFGAQLVVLDSLHDLFPGNENDRTQARRFIGMLRHVALSVDGAVNRAFVDPVRRDTHGLDLWQSVINEAKSRIPGYSKDLPPRTNMWGEPIVLGGGLGPDIVSPIYTSETKSSPVDEEIVRLGVPVTMPRRQIGGVQLTATEYHRYVELAGNAYKDPSTGQGLKETLEAVVTGNHPMSGSYRMATDGPEGGKAQIISRVVMAYRQAAQQTLLNETPELRELVDQRQRERQRNIGS